MKFHLDTAEIFIPDGQPIDSALSRTTHLCFAAHQDDIEIMAANPIVECFQQADKWFTGVVVTDTAPPFSGTMRFVTVKRLPAKPQVAPVGQVPMAALPTPAGRSSTSVRFARRLPALIARSS